MGAVAISLCWPLAKVYWFASHEGVQYVTRTVEYAEALARGDFYPRWCVDFYDGYGSPFFNFYAPLVYALGGVLTHVVGSPVVALKLVILMGSAAAGLATFGLVRLETRRPDAGFVGACLYLAAPYRLAEVTWRGDLAEFTALGLLPLTLYGYRRVVHEPNPRLLPWIVSFAALSHAALNLSHTLTGLWGTGIVAVTLLASVFQLLRRHARERALLLGVAFAGALLLSAPYTLPAMFERSYVRTETMTLDWAYPPNNWLLPRQLWEPGAFSVGPALAAATTIVAIGSLLRRRIVVAALPWLAGALLLACLSLPVAVPLWKSSLIPFGKYIQFPWRLLGPSALCAATAFGVAWANLFPPRFVSELIALPAVAFALHWAEPQTELQGVDPESVMLSGRRIREASVSGTGLDEYLPRVVARVPTSAPKGIARSNESVRVDIERSRGTTHALRLSARRAAELELNLHAFPGWRAKTEGPTKPVELATSPSGLVLLKIPEAGDYLVSVSFGSTPARALGFLLFLLGLGGVCPTARWLAGGATRPKSRAMEIEPKWEGLTA